MFHGEKTSVPPVQVYFRISIRMGGFFLSSNEMEAFKICSALYTNIVHNNFVLFQSKNQLANCLNRPSQLDT